MQRDVYVEDMGLNMRILTDEEYVDDCSFNGEIDEFEITDTTHFLESITHAERKMIYDALVEMGIE